MLEGRDIAMTTEDRRITYSSLTEVICFGIEPMLGELADNYDLKALADEFFDLTVDEDESGVQIGNAYFVANDIYSDEGNADSFYKILARHDHRDQLDSLVAAAWAEVGEYDIIERIGDDESKTRHNKVFCLSSKKLKVEMRNVFMKDGDWDFDIEVVKLKD